MDVTLRLPDELLLEVFSYLEPWHLLKNREVCRRWRDLGLDRYAWKSIHLRVETFPDKALMRTVLQLAPCLHKLSIYEDDVNSLYAITPLHTTNCIIAQLKISYEFSEETVDTLKLILEHQRSIGGLQCVDVHLFFGCNPCRQRMILRKFGDVGCDVLSIWDSSVSHIIGYDRGYDHYPEEFLTEFPVKSSLRELNYRGQECKFSLWFLLKVHCSTLRVLSIYNEYSFNRDSVPLEAISQLTHLEKISCPFFPQIDTTLLQHPNLSDITLFGRIKDADMDAVKNLLRHAVALKHLTLQIQFLPFLPRLPYYFDLLEAAASSMCSQIETLTIEISGEEFTEAHWERLRKSMPGMPALREFRVKSSSSDFVANAPPVGFLRSLCSASAPSLRLLPVNIVMDCPRAKASKQIRGLPGVTVRQYLAELRALMQRLPELHVAGLRFSFTCRCAMSRWGRDCWADVLELLPGASVDLEKKYFGLHSHENSKCNLNTLTTLCRSWVRLI